MKGLRVPAKWFIRRLASFLTKTKIPDLNSGFRAFRTSVARQYLRHLPTGFSCVTTMTMTFLSGGYSVKYIPIDYAKRAGQSKFHPVKDTRRYGVQVVRMVLSYDPLRLFLPAGAVLLLLGFAKGIYDAARYDFHITTTTLILLFAAFQLFVIGLLADLVVRVSRERDEVPVAAEVQDLTVPDLQRRHAGSGGALE
jgi:hypothetical protein